MKKRYFSLLLAAVLAFSLMAVGCGDKTPDGSDPASSRTDSSTTTTGTDVTTGGDKESSDTGSSHGTTTKVPDHTTNATAETTITTKTTSTTAAVVTHQERMTAQQWVSKEIVFTSAKDYKETVYEVDMDVVFTHKKTGKTLRLPAFWDGGRVWKVRFALTEVGEWGWRTVCTDTANTGLHNHVGQVTCKAYTGDLAIYQHGFLKTRPGKPYFMYADDTPFFYLGDTHWTLPMEEIDGIGDLEEQVAREKGITSQFKYSMDYRAAQGYTVIQSQQLAEYCTGSGNSWMFNDLYGEFFDYGVDDYILAKFQELDRYFAYIAEKGFVHAHTQFCYPEELIERQFVTDGEIEKLCRYWVARYAAYPVMWTTAQEGDNDYYGYGGCTPEDNPWKMVMEWVAKYDPYDHPSTCHQEHTGDTRVDNSAFADLPSHSWFAAQWTLSTGNGSTLNWSMLKEYWNNFGAKPAVNYEGHYDKFWTDTFGARAQGWVAYLNGQFGYGYGVSPIWSISWSAERNVPWLEGLEAEAGQQLIYLKDFFTQYDWWKLEPCFDGNKYYTPGGTNYSVATVGNDLYLGYFYGTSVRTPDLGVLTGMEQGEYTVRWMNCRTGEYTVPETVPVTDGTYTIPGKPDSGDWALAVVQAG